MPAEARLAGRIVLLTGKGAARRRSCAGWRGQDRRLALAGALHAGGRGRAAARQDTPVAHPATCPGDRRARRERSRRADRRARRLIGLAPAMAKVVDISVSSVQRIWRAHGLQPHRLRQFKLSNDPNFAASCAISSASTSIRQHTPWCSRWTRRARSRRSIAPSPGCR